MTLNDTLAACSGPVVCFPSSFSLQGGVYGGVVLAVAVHRIERVTKHPIRALQINFSALARPEVETHFECKVMRRGSKTETINYAFYQDEQCVAHGAAFTGRARDTMPDQCFLAPPSAPTPEALAGVPSTMILPPFAAHFDMKPCLGEPPLSGAMPAAGGYIAFKDTRMKTMGAAHLAAMADAWWPSFYATSKTMRPMATTSLQLVFHAQALPIKNQTCLLEVRGGFLSGGFGSEVDRLWSDEGALLVTAHQCIAVIA